MNEPRHPAMSRHQLRGTAAWDDCGEGLSSLGRDFRWVLGYDPAGITYYAQLWDQAPMDDPDCPLTDEELASPVLSIGDVPYSVPTLEDLEREMDMDLPDDLVATLREERRRHFAGQLGEDAAAVRDRELLFREVELRVYLREVQRFLGQPGA